MYLKSILTKTLMTLCAVVALHTVASETLGQTCSCSSGTITCTGTITASDQTAATRAGTNGGTCATPVACTSSGFAGPFHFRATAFTNTIAGTTCYTVNLANNSCAQSLEGYAYLTTYNAASGQECTNYLADNALGVANMTNNSFSFNLTLNQRVVIVVLDRTANGDCAGGTYTLTISHTGASATTCPGTPTAADGTVSGRITDSNGVAVAGATINLSGSQSRKTITDANGNYQFDDIETNGFYTVTPSRANYTFSPSNRSFSQLGEHTDAVFTGSADGSTLNPLDVPEYFVRQHYLDFLNREPDESGFNFWSNNILSCGGDASCIDVQRINTSAAFFLSIEFQQTGYEVYRLYKTAYGDLPGAPVPIRFNEFLPDTREIAQGVIVNQAGWEQTLENNKQAFANEFVSRSRFGSLYANMNNGQFVDALNQNAGSVLSQYERDELVTGLTSGMKTRAQVLRAVAENGQLQQQEFNRAFVLMQYFGYLQRDPNSGPDTDFSGYNFWLNKLNTFNGNFQDAEMVKAFLVSGEYRGRFPR
jgi:hypothetical protein